MLRASAIELMGSGIGSVSLPRLFEAVRGVLNAAASAGFEIAARSVPLSDVERAWAADDSAARVVFRP